MARSQSRRVERNGSRRGHDAKSRRALLGEWARSGLSAAAFARRAGVSCWTLYSWRKARRRAGDLRAGFVELSAVRAPESPVHGALELVLSGGQVIRVADGFDATTLRRLVAALESA